MNPTLSIAVIVVLVAVVLMRVERSHAGGVPGTDDQWDEQPTILPVADATALDTLFAASHQATTLLFLHDPGCPISRAAYKQMMRLDDNLSLPLLDVRHAQALTRAVEQRTGVRHESPQVLVLSGGAAVWSASHYAITAQTVTDALAHATEPGEAGS